MDSDNQHMSHNLDGLQSGLYPHQFESYYQDPPSNGYGASWNYPTTKSPLNQDHQSLTGNAYPSWQQNNASNPQSFDAFDHGYTENSQYLQPHAYANYGDPRQYQKSPFDPSLASGSEPETQFDQSSQSLYGARQQANATIAPHALETQSSLVPQKQQQQQQQQYHVSNVGLQYQPAYTPVPPVDQNALLSKIPHGDEIQNFLVINYDKLSSATHSKRLNQFVNVSQDDYEYPINKAIMPKLVKRRSRNELRELASNDQKLMAKLGKKKLKKTSSVPKVSHEQKAITAARSGHQLLASRSEPSSSSDDSSSEYDSSDSESEDDEPSPLPEKRPDDDPKEAIEYDTIKALWRGRKQELTEVDIKNGLKEYWDVVRTIRDRWKDDTKVLGEAIEKGRKGDLVVLKSRVKDQRNMVEVAFKAGLKHGSNVILEHLAENVSFLFLCYQFLLDRHKEDDLNGSLPQSILGILATCKTLTKEKLEKTHLSKLLPRYLKKGDAETQKLVRQIEDVAKQGSDKMAEGGKVKTAAISTAKPISESKPTAAVKTDSVAGVKRAAPGTTNEAQSVKRIAGAANGSPRAAQGTTKPATVPVAKPLGAAKGPVKAISMTVGPPPPQKTKAAVSKPSSFFSGLQTTAKKPVAAVNAKPAATSVLASALKGLEDKPAVKSARPQAAAPVKPSFSFADTLANITMPKEEKPPTPKAEVERAPETAEERRKRLRKEARRGLRVSFRPESTLVEVKYFTHDPDEELGHDASMTRDAGDVGGEGRMFKQHKDMVDIDEDEDTRGEEVVKAYHAPGAIDFGDVDPGERERNYSRFAGGELSVDSPEKATREQHETETLMAIYTSPEDIPPTPKEPAEIVGSDESTPCKTFGEPTAVVKERAARLPGPQATHQVTQLGAQQASTAPDIAAILAAFNPQQQQPQSQAAPAPALPTLGHDNSAAIQSILAKFQSTGQQSPPPPQMAQQQPQQPALPPNLANIFASLQPQVAQNMQSQPQQAPPMQSSDNNNASLAALLAQLGQAPQPPPPANGFGANGFPIVPFPPPGMPQMQQPPQQPQDGTGLYENEERKRWRESGDDGGEEGGYQNKRKKGSWADKRFTQPCKYFQQGRCQKGDKCTYLHE